MGSGADPRVMEWSFARLARRIDAAIEPSTSLTEALRAVLAELRGALGFDLAKAWTRHPGTDGFALAAVDVAPERDDLAAFAAASAHRPLNGTSPTGRAAASGVVVVTPDLASDPTFLHPAVREVGLRSAVHVPLDLGGEPEVVIGFLRSGPIDGDGSVGVLGELRQHLSSVLSRHLAHIEASRFFLLSQSYGAISALDGRVRRVNPSMLAALGYEEHELVGRPFTDLVHPDDVQHTAAAIDTLLTSAETTVPFDARVRTQSGTYRSVSWSSHAASDEGLVYAIGRDITVELAEQRFKDRVSDVLRSIASGDPLDVSLPALIGLLESQDDDVAAAVILIEPPGGNLRVAAAPSLPQPLIDAIEQRRDDVTDDGLWDGLRDLAGTAGLRSCSSMPIRSQDGAVLGSLVAYSRTAEPPTARLRAIIADLVNVAGIAIQRSRADQQLNENEERFRLLAEVTTDAIWDWDLVTDTRWRSDGFRTLFGYTPGTMVPEERWWSSKLHPADRQTVLASRNNALAGTDESWQADYRFQRVDGTYADVSVRATIVRDSDGRPVRMIGGMSDVTQRRQLERRYLRAQRAESLGTLAGGIAHDLNNTLTPIIMATEFLEEDDIGPGARRSVELIRRSARRGAELVRQILSCSRGMASEHTTLSVADLIDDVVQITRDTSPATIAIDTDAVEPVPPIFGDETQLHHVLLNLAVNAREAMPDGGTLSFSTDQMVVSPDDTPATAVALLPGEYVRIAVTDTGTGISAAIRDRMFEPFFTTKPLSQGPGLGLPTSLAIARNHGGGISVESTPGNGSTFSVYLPVASARRAAPAAPPPQ